MRKDFHNIWGNAQVLNVIFASTRKRSEIQVYFFAFFAFFAFFYFFSLNFRFTSIFSLNFRLFYLRFRFRFLVFHIEVNHVKSGFFSLRSETKFSLQFQISLPKRKWGRTLKIVFNYLNYDLVKVLELVVHPLNVEPVGRDHVRPNIAEHFSQLIARIPYVSNQEPMFWIHMFLSLPDPDPLVKNQDPDPLSSSKNSVQ